jgi:DNA-binding response OmpR family regulator
MRKDLEELGWRVEHVAKNINEAKKLARSVDVNLAILDINIEGEPSYSVAKIFKRRGIPLIFITGYIGERIRTNYPEASILSKPYSFVDLQHTVRHALLTASAVLPIGESEGSAPKQQ